VIKWRNNLPGHFFVLFIYTILAIIFAHFTNYHPILRESLELGIRGLILGLFASFFVIIISLLGVFLSKKQSKANDNLKKVEQNNSFLLATPLVLAFGEEFFLRGFVFGYFVQSSPLTAYIVNVFLTLIAAFLSNLPNYYGRIGYSLVARISLGAVYAMFYSIHHSLFLIIIARFTEELIVLAVHRQKKYERLVSILNAIIGRRYGYQHRRA
jgi:hypothetical protein